jgi:hypothetical protein
MNDGILLDVFCSLQGWDVDRMVVLRIGVAVALFPLFRSSSFSALIADGRKDLDEISWYF